MTSQVLPLIWPRKLARALVDTLDRCARSTALKADLCDLECANHRLTETSTIVANGVCLENGMGMVSHEVTVKTEQLAQLPETVQTLSVQPAAAAVTTISPSPPLDPPALCVKPDSKFLLVDDNAINLRILGAFVKKLGKPYDTAVNGQEAVDAFVAEPIGTYSCIFMDVSMPVMDGFEASRQIRRHETEAGAVVGCPIIAVTATASAAAQQEAYESVIDLFLTKPVTMKKLKEVLVARRLLTAP